MKMSLSPICKVEHFKDYFEFLSFLKAVEKDFVPPLLSRINPIDYYQKIESFGIVLKCFINSEIAGVAVMYANDLKSKTAFITFIATKEQFRGKHIATNLLTECFKVAKSEGMKYIEIETNNLIARECYLRVGFVETTVKQIENTDLSRYFLKKEL